MSIIVALSGGKASAWCADWALKQYPKDDVILYFNDTKWEHKDLYRFLEDLSKYLNHPITVDADGRSPEDVFYDLNALANNRMPICSAELKAKRLQDYYKDGDTIIFGISADEIHRAHRLTNIYEARAYRTKKKVTLRFPLIEKNISKEQVDTFLKEIGIEEPFLYKLGFSHNNCSGGCVRGSKAQWALLYEKLPEVYLERERVEEEVREYLGKDVSYLKDYTLRDLRAMIERGEVKSSKARQPDDVTDCIGICSTTA